MIMQEKKTNEVTDHTDDLKCPLCTAKGKKLLGLVDSNKCFGSDDNADRFLWDTIWIRSTVAKSHVRVIR